MHKEKLKYHVIERYAEQSHPERDESNDTASDESSPNFQTARFMKMVAVRKRQMLEKILIDES